MATIRFRTRRHVPGELVTVRAAPAWDRDLPGLYDGEAWEFDVPDPPGGSPFDFKFVLGRQFWMTGPDLRWPPEGGEREFDDGDVAFPDAARRLVEGSAVARRLLAGAPPPEPERRHDVIVIGSGMGGGVLADELSDAGRDVLLLEAGGLVFPTHVGNLPRRHKLGTFDKHVWGLWEDFKVRDVTGVGEDLYVGGQGFNLGGRSVFWGGLIPRMAEWELAAWPQEVATFLTEGGYAEAEERLNASPPGSAEYRDLVLQTLGDALPELEHRPAPLAVHRAPATSGVLSTGVFSTADLLLESLLTPGAAGNEHLRIALNTVAVRLELDGDRVTGVVARDLIGNREVIYRADVVVLAAGTIESARLVLGSNVPVASGLAGTGVTDHPIFFTHFQIPADRALAELDDAAKTVARHRQAAADAHGYLMVVELGADLNQGRYVDDDLVARRADELAGAMLCEVVFLLSAPLIDVNRLTLPAGGDPLKPVDLQVTRAAVDDALLAEVAEVKDRVIAAVGGQELPGGSLDLVEAGLGGVAHEVGSLRMSSDPATGVVDETLKVHGMANLYACDLSVFPTSPAANPSLTLVALARRLARTL